MLTEIITSLVLISIMGKICQYTIATEAKSRYFLIHAIINLFVSYFIWGDIYQILLQPSILYTQALTNTMGFSIAIALHFYHCLFYKLNKLDWIHHIVMIFIATPFTLYFQPWIVSNPPLLMLNGIPGAIDYFLLYLTEKNIIKDKLIEKRINVYLNTWIRAPVSLIMVGMGLTELINNQRWQCIPCLFFVAWNVIYFQNLTVRAAYTKYGEKI